MPAERAYVPIVLSQLMTVNELLRANLSDRGPSSTRPGAPQGQDVSADGSETILNADEALDGEDILPGFSCELRSIL